MRGREQRMSRQAGSVAGSVRHLKLDHAIVFLPRASIFATCCSPGADPTASDSSLLRLVPVKTIGAHIQTHSLH